MYDISLCIVTYNNEKVIEKAINSIVTSLGDRLSYVLFIVDNASTDKTLDRVSICKGNIKVIKNTVNIGFGAAHNQVMEHLDSRYHVVVNPDIEIVNSSILDMYCYMNENLEIGLLTPLIKFPNGEVQYLCKRNPTFFDLCIRLILPNSFLKRQEFFTMRETGYNKPFEVEYASGCFMFFRTNIFIRIKGFDDRFFLYLEDADITRRVNQISKTVFFPYNYVLHEWQREQHKSAKLMWINFKSAIYYFTKWHRKY